MNKIYLWLFIIASSCNACELPSSGENYQSTKAYLEDLITYPLSQPLVLRENLVSDRGFTPVDSLGAALLQFEKAIPNHQKWSIYLLGKVDGGAEDLGSYLFLGDSPEESNAWLLSYDAAGKLSSSLHVYQGIPPNINQRSGYLKDNKVEIKLKTGKTLLYQLGAKGQVLEIGTPEEKEGPRAVE